MALADNNTDVGVISESNFKTNDKKEIDKRKKAYKNYNFEDKCPMNNDTSRVSLAIRKGVTYERLPQFENDINMSIWVRIKTGRRKWTYFCGC